MARLKKIYFENADAILEYYNKNRDEIYSRTYEFLNKFYTKNNYVDNVNVYEIKVSTFPEMKYISVLRNEWDICLNEMMDYYVEKEQYLEADKIKKLLHRIFKT